MNKAVQAGLVAGYFATCAQLTDGYGMRFKKMRDTWLNACDTVAEQAADKEKYSNVAQAVSLKNLVTCGWCLAPFITFPVWLLMARETGLKGFLTAVSVCAFSRHMAEMY